MSYVERRPERPGPNERCHCGSGLKYKRCHRERDAQDERDRAPVRIVAAGRVVGLSGDAALQYRRAGKDEQLAILADIARQQEERTRLAEEAAKAAGVVLREAPPADRPLVLPTAENPVPRAPEIPREELARFAAASDSLAKRVGWTVWWPFRRIGWALRMAWWAFVQRCKHAFRQE